MRFLLMSAHFYSEYWFEIFPRSILVAVLKRERRRSIALLLDSDTVNYKNQI